MYIYIYMSAVKPQSCIPAHTYFFFYNPHLFRRILQRQVIFLTSKSFASLKGSDTFFHALYYSIRNDIG